MASVIRNAPTYVMVGLASAIALRNAPVYVMVGDAYPFPTGVTGKQAVLNMIKALTNQNFAEGAVTLGYPSVNNSLPNGRNATVTLTAHPISRYTGETDFHYTRIAISDKLAAVASSIVISGETSVHQLIPKLNTAAGIVFSEDDLVDSAIGGGATSTTLTVASTSYFFIPGDTIQVGT